MALIVGESNGILVFPCASLGKHRDADVFFF